MKRVLIVGGGLAGLPCGVRLPQGGGRALYVEAHGDRGGGGRAAGGGGGAKWEALGPEGWAGRVHRRDQLGGRSGGPIGDLPRRPDRFDGGFGPG